MIWDLYARPEIKSGEQLRGKIVGTDRPGSPVAYGTLVALRKLGLSSRDVQLRPFGGSIQVASALQSGQIAAGAAGPPVSFHIVSHRAASPICADDLSSQLLSAFDFRPRIQIPDHGVEHSGYEYHVEAAQ
jgi:TRAP-type uncharacterized transport system substrate-binding protein